MTGASLYARSRRLGWVLAALLILALSGWRAASWLSSRPYFDGPNARVPVVAVLPLLAAIAFSVTLADADRELERTVPRLTGAWRLVHALAGVLLCAGLLATTELSQPWVFGCWALIRNVAGLCGLILLAAGLLPVNLSWSPALGYLFVVYLAAPQPPTGPATWLAWPMRAGRLDPSWLVAGLLLLVGLNSYRRFGLPHGTGLRQ